MREHLGSSPLDLGCFLGQVFGRQGKSRQEKRWLIKVVQAGVGGRKG